MNLLDLRTAARLRLQDQASGVLWEDDELDDFANLAEREACERAKLIEDATTAAVCEIAGLVNTATYNLHAKIIEVSSVTWDGRFLTGISRDQLNDQYPNGWKTRTGRPTHFIDPQQHTLTLFPIPTVAADIELIAYRYPLEDMLLNADEPEIAAIHHDGLLDWMEHLGYLKHDTETENVEAAARAEARFTQKFGVKIDANTRRTQRARRLNVVRMNPNW